MQSKNPSESILFDPIPLHYPALLPTNKLLKPTYPISPNSSARGVLEPTPLRDSAPSLQLMADTTANALEKPKRPLTAYNMFFQHERRVLLDSLPVIKKSKRGHGKISFADMAKVIGKRWKEADTKTRILFSERANEQKLLYHQAMDEYRSKKGATASPETFLECLDAGIPLLADQLGKEMTDIVVRAFL